MGIRHDFPIMRGENNKNQAAGINHASEVSHDQNTMHLDFEQLVNDHYQNLYRFALSLSRSQADACDLTQQTFVLWAERGHQLKKTDKVKSWLFTTLYREYLRSRRRNDRFPHVEVSAVEHELPTVEADALAKMAGDEVMALLSQLDETFRAPLTLFYLGDHGYKDIAQILEVPIGTVMSRISRGKEQLRALFARHEAGSESNILPLSALRGQA